MKQQMYAEWFQYMKNNGDPALMELYCKAALKGVAVSRVGFNSITEQDYMSKLYEEERLLEEAINAVSD